MINNIKNISVPLWLKAISTMMFGVIFFLFYSTFALIKIPEQLTGAKILLDFKPYLPAISLGILVISGILYFIYYENPDETPDYSNRLFFLSSLFFIVFLIGSFVFPPVAHLCALGIVFYSAMHIVLFILFTLFTGVAGIFSSIGGLTFRPKFSLSKRRTKKTKINSK